MIEHVGDDAALYALGALDDAQRDACDLHASACPACAALLGQPVVQQLELGRRVDRCQHQGVAGRSERRELLGGYLHGRPRLAGGVPAEFVLAAFVFAGFAVAAAFFTGAFFAAVFFAAVCRAAVCRVGAFLAGAFSAGAFSAGAFLAAGVDFTVAVRAFLVRS